MCFDPQNGPFMTRIFRCNLPVGEEAEHEAIEVHDRAEGVILKQGVGAVKVLRALVVFGLFSFGSVLPHAPSWCLSTCRSTSSADLSAVSSSSDCCAGHERTGGLPGGRELGLGSDPRPGRGAHVFYPPRENADIGAHIVGRRFRVEANIRPGPFRKDRQARIPTCL